MRPYPFGSFLWIGSAFFVGFKQAGVRIDGGHEVMVIEAWLAECYWSENTMCTASQSSLKTRCAQSPPATPDEILREGTGKQS